MLYCSRQTATLDEHWNVTCMTLIACRQDGETYAYGTRESRIYGSLAAISIFVRSASFESYYPSLA